jgi:ribonuclease BN (tRNA processing enzyme)
MDDRAGSGLRLTVVGSGDAFGSGGRLQTCFHLAAAGGGECLVDCGATALAGMSRAGLSPDRVGAIALSHLHGDHFSGLVFFLLHAQYVSRRTAPLVVAGPAGTEQRLEAALEALFPGSSRTRRRFEMVHAAYTNREPLDLPGFTVTPFEVSHPAGAPAYALRVGAGGRVLTYSGDTEWTESLVEAAAGADAFICECSSFAAQVPYHLSWRRIEPEIARLTARRVVLTHMGPETLARRAEISHDRVQLAEDGLIIDL